MGTAADAAQRVLDGLVGRPGGAELLELASPQNDLALVGGAVRDLLLGLTPRELDVVVAGGSAELASELASLLPVDDVRTTVHERFGTASVDWPAGRIDIAARRAESYAHPGALPEVRPGTAIEDLARRDFTVNAIAVPLASQGELLAVEHALDDLMAGRLRVLHDRSFLDDPTRLLRLARYAARLGFEVEAETARLASEALSADALRTVSGGRIGAELWLAAEEASALVTMGDLGVLSALLLRSPYDERLLAEATALLPTDGSPSALALAVLLHGGELTEDLELPAHTRDRVLAAASGALTLERTLRASQLRALLAGQPVEAVALAGALGGPQARENAARWLSELRHVRLEINGGDLLAAGLSEGPEVGRRLARTLDMKLDGELQGGREAELQAALKDRQ
jgi:tRNA nucleotidyltransferase (CCA-adding enzyme)